MKLSIIIIDKTNSHECRKTLSSVESQTSKEFELLVLKDNNNTMNDAITRATGEYILFLNSGDILANDTVIEEWLKYDVTADIVACNAIVEKSKTQDETLMITPSQISASHLILSSLPYQATFIRRQLFKDVNSFNAGSRIVLDQFFFIETLLKHNATYQHINMFVARCNTDGINSEPHIRKLLNEESDSGLKKMLPYFYSDIVELHDYRRKQHDERLQLIEKLSQSNIGLTLLRLRHYLSGTGYYKFKARLNNKRFLRKLQKEDKTKKQKIAQYIDSLPFDMLQRMGDQTDFIVSLTSYGKRVADAAPYAIYSLMTQSCLPNRIVLWLDQEQWNDDNLPPLLKRLQKSGLEICYCEDVRSFTKLLPALRMFPDNPIIVVDDDFYYNKDLIRWLVSSFENSDRHTIFATWACIPEMQNGRYLPYLQWKDCKYGDRNSEYSLFACGGCIYPPHIFDEEVFNQKQFMQLCPTADDIWFWVHEKRLRIKIELTPVHGHGLHTSINRIEEFDLTQQGTLFYTNCIQGMNNEQLRNVLDYYQIDGEGLMGGGNSRSSQ